jgi:hypothetical protein
LGEVADEFQDTMKTLFDEDPGLFETTINGETMVHSTKATWSAQVDAAGDEFHEALKALVEKFEVRLLQGEFA